MDLLVKLAANLNFTFDLHLSNDKKFGALVEVILCYEDNNNNDHDDYEDDDDDNDYVDDDHHHHHYG